MVILGVVYSWVYLPCYQHIITHTHIYIYIHIHIHIYIYDPQLSSASGGNYNPLTVTVTYRPFVLFSAFALSHSSSGKIINSDMVIEKWLFHWIKNHDYPRLI